MGASFVDTIVSQTMKIDLTRAGAKARARLEDLCTDLFLIVIRMREAEDLGEPVALRKLIVYYINLFEKNCSAINLPAESVDMAKYAMVALLDETVLSLPGICRDHWITSPLQLEYFGNNLAGEEFFRRLDKLLIEPEKQKSVIGIFYLCLSLGFEGKYKIGNADERLKIIDNVGRQLAKTRSQKVVSLSPHGERLMVKKLRRGSQRNAVSLWLIGVASIIAIALLWGVLTEWSNNALDAVLDKL
jgi:type VI secretion system protein ImpK